MEILAQKLAEFLEIGIDKAVEVYPLLRGQFIAYEVLERINSTCVFLVVAILASMAMGTYGFFTYEEEFGFEDDKKAIKRFKKILIAFAVFVVLLIATAFVTNLLQVILAPDLLMFKQLL